MASTRRLAAILAADVEGYSRLMGAAEEGTLERLKALRRGLLDPKFAEHKGRLVKTTGDGMLVEFASVVDAVRCAMAVQQAMAERNTGVAAGNRIELRIGINLGDVIVEDGDIYGEGVNIAARIEALAEAGRVFVSNAVYDHVRDRLPFTFEDLGEQHVKNIARPVRVYRVRPEPLRAAGGGSGNSLGQAREGVFAFEGYTLDLTRGCVSGTGGEIELRPKSFELLSYLVANPGRLIPKDELVNAVWPDVIVSDDSLAQCVSDVRRALNDPGRQIIRTVPRRGYLFAAPVSAGPPQSAGSRPVAAADTSVSRLSVVVLPFTNLSNDLEQEFFADAITDDLTADLSLIPGSVVIARTTAFSYKGKPVDIRQIGRELGVRYVLEGSVRRAGGQVQVTAQLIDAENGAHIWADRFDADRIDLAVAQGEIVGRLYQTLLLELFEAAATRIEQEKPANADPRDLVVHGWALYQRPLSAANREAALREFERALEIDPASVEARVGIATVLGEYMALGWSRSPEDMARAEQMLVEAFARNRNHPRALFEMGRLRRLQNRLIESNIELEKAIALDRNHSGAMLQLGITLMFLGQPQAALLHLEKSMRLRPRVQNVFYPYYWMGYCHLLLGHIDEAIDLLRRGRAANPKLGDTHRLLAAALALRGDIGEAKASLAEAFRLDLWYKSFAQFRAVAPAYMTNPAFVALRQQTIDAGLRRIGFPEE